MRVNKELWLLLMVAVFAVPAIAAETFSFTRISSNSAWDISDQLVLEVSESGSDVLFKLQNLVGLQSNVAEIYIYSRTPASIEIDIYGQSGTTFRADNKLRPEDLPGLKGSEYSLFSVLVYGVDSDQGAGSSGLNSADDYLTLRLKDIAYDDVVNALGLSGDASLLVGMHVRSLPDGESDGYVTGKPPVVPAPGAIVLAGIGTTLVGWLRRRRSL